MRILTIFTPSYNRAHTITRTYNSLLRQTCKDFEWLVIDDGSTDNTQCLVEGWIKDNKIPIRYFKKENGGLYTGYNTAYANIDTELNVCIDSDDFMPDNAVEIIVSHWKKYGGERYAGMTGLDFTLEGEPIGGYFPNDLKEGYLIDYRRKYQHHGDTKQVMRTDIMKKVAPLTGFSGEKNFNPIYLLMQADQMLPSLFINHNLCFVDYQIGADSMSSAIFHQYVDSPKSFAKMRMLEMVLKRNTLRNIIRVCIHYNASTIIAKDKEWLKKSPRKFLTVATRPFGYILASYIRYKANQ